MCINSAKILFALAAASMATSASATFYSVEVGIKNGKVVREWRGHCNDDRTGRLHTADTAADIMNELERQCGKGNYGYNDPNKGPKATEAKGLSVKRGAVMTPSKGSPRPSARTIRAMPSRTANIRANANRLKPFLVGKIYHNGDYERVNLAGRTVYTFKCVSGSNKGNRFFTSGDASLSDVRSEIDRHCPD